jgi:hypothetical protein
MTRAEALTRAENTWGKRKGHYSRPGSTLDTPELISGEADKDAQPCATATRTGTQLIMQRRPSPWHGPAACTAGPLPHETSRQWHTTAAGSSLPPLTSSRTMRPTSPSRASRVPVLPAGSHRQQRTRHCVCVCVSVGVGRPRSCGRVPHTSGARKPQQTPQSPNPHGAVPLHPLSAPQQPLTPVSGTGA